MRVTSEKNSENEEILLAGRDDLTDAELAEMVEDYSYGKYSDIKRLILRVRENISRNMPSSRDIPLSRILEKVRHRLYAPNGPKEQNLRATKELLRRDRLCTFKINGKAVGMVGISEVGKLPNGLQVCEIARASTLKKYRGRGYYNRLVSFAEDKARELYPDALIMRITVVETVKNHCERAGWKKVDLGQQTDLTDFIKRHPDYGPKLEEGAQVYYWMQK